MPAGQFVYEPFPENWAAREGMKGFFSERSWRCTKYKGMRLQDGTVWVEAAGIIGSMISSAPSSSPSADLRTQSQTYMQQMHLNEEA